MIYLDTHVVVWLYAGLVEKISGPAAAAIEGHTLLMSPMVRLELQFLKETGRIDVPPSRIVTALEGEIGLSLCSLPFAAVLHHAEAAGWTRDPFDRVIVGQAKAGKSSLVTRDEVIRRHFPDAIW